MHTNRASVAQDMMRTITGPWRAQCLHAAAKLGIPDLIAEGFADDSALSDKTGVIIDRMKRLMRFLVADGTFQRDSHQQYENTESSILLMKNGGAMYDTVMLYGEELYRCWGNLHAALTTTQSGFELQYDKDFYSYLIEHPDVLERFQRTLKSRKAIFDDLPNLIDFDGKLLVDVGGGTGQLTRTILDAAPLAKAILFDLPETIEVAGDYLAHLVDAKRVTLEQGDMFASVPNNADFYVLSRVLGDLSDSSALALLRNCRHAMGDGSEVLIIEQLVSTSSPSEISTLWDLHLLMVCNGRQRSHEELEQLLTASNLRLERVITLPLGMSLLRAHPTS